MLNTYTIASARNEFAKIVKFVDRTGNSITVSRYGVPMIRVVPVSNSKNKVDWTKTAKKYGGIWSGPKNKWADKIGKPSRNLSKRNYWL